MPPTTSLCLRSRIATSRKREIVAGRGQWDTRSGAGFARGRDQQHTWSGVRGGLRPRSEVGGGTAENRFSNPAHRRGKTHLSANNQISALHSPARVRRSVVSAPASPRRRLRAGRRAKLAGLVRWVCAFGTFSGGGTSRRLKGFGTGPPRRHPPAPDSRPRVPHSPTPGAARPRPPTPGAARPQTSDCGRSPPPTMGPPDPD